MNKKKPSPYLPLTHALGWIVGSMLVVNGISYAFLKKYLHTRRQRASSPEKLVRSIVQTGPQKEALKTEYLAEILGLCADHPRHIFSYDLKELERKLLASPLISKARVSVLKPSSLYIDYTARQPMAYLADFENVVIDREGYPFPCAPFFSPKNLPEIYLGLAAFGAPSEDPDKPCVQWGSPLGGKYFDIALNLLSYLTDPAVSECFNVTWIDVSRAFSPSCGNREIVLITQDVLFLNSQRYSLPRVLRLSMKNYTQELGNYLTLREQLLEEDSKRLSVPGAKIPERIIYFRLPNLAFIEEK